MPRISKGTALYVRNEETFKKLKNLKSTPDFSKGAKASVETTTLEDNAKKYMAGIREPSDKISFGFLYDAGENESSFDLLKTMENGTFVFAFPDGTAFRFDADCDVTIGAAEVGGALSFSLVLIPSSLIEETSLDEVLEVSMSNHGDPTSEATEGGEDE